MHNLIMKFRTLTKYQIDSLAEDQPDIRRPKQPKAGLSVGLFEKSLGEVYWPRRRLTKTRCIQVQVIDYAKHASKYAVNVPEASFDLAKIIARKSKVVRKLVSGVKSKLTAHQVTLVQGEACIVEHEIKTTIYDLLICTGNMAPPLPHQEVNYWTHRDSTEAPVRWSL